MSFNINGVPIVENVGTLGLFSGVTDPSGWLICDGAARDNTTGVYNNLYKQATGKNYGYGPSWTNYGISSTITSVSGLIPLTDVRSVAVSDVGTVVLADRGNMGLYISQNNGSTWAAISSASLPAISFSCVDISADGTKIVAAANVVGQGLFLSTNTGSTWTQLYTQNGLPTDLVSMDNGSNKVAISNDGTKIAVAYTNGYVYYSSTSGTSFKSVTLSEPIGNSQTRSQVMKNYWGLGMSKDGNKLVTAVNNESLTPDITKISWTTNPGVGLTAGDFYYNAIYNRSG
jgi:microcystin-dependent protein